MRLSPKCGLPYFGARSCLNRQFRASLSDVQIRRFGSASIVAAVRILFAELWFSLRRSDRRKCSLSLAWCRVPFNMTFVIASSHRHEPVISSRHHWSLIHPKASQAFGRRPCGLDLKASRCDFGGCWIVYWHSFSDFRQELPSNHALTP